jgi:hypothetical protein
MAHIECTFVARFSGINDTIAALRLRIALVTGTGNETQENKVSTVTGWRVAHNHESLYNAFWDDP